MREQPFTCYHLEVTTDLHELASQAAGAMVKVRLRLGRTLVSLRRQDRLKDAGCNSIRHYSRVLGLRGGEGAEYARVAERLEALPALTAAAEQGRVSWAVLVLLTEFVTDADEHAWLVLAQKWPLDKLEQFIEDCRNPGGSGERVVRWKLDAETTVLVDQAMRKLSEQHGRMLSPNDGLKLMAAYVLTGGAEPGALEKLRRDAELDLRAELDRRRRLQDRALEEFGQPVGVKLVKIAEVAPWQNGLVRFNPRARVLTAAQRAEILRRDGYRCCTPHCSNVLWLQVHHVHFFYLGGQTVPQNLIVLCSACHHMVHEGSIVLKGEAPDRLIFTDADGRRLDEFKPYQFAEWLEEFYDPVDWIAA